MDPITFETSPQKYKHWRLVTDAANPVARLLLQVDESAPLRPGYPLKLNSYDLSVDIELADAIQRLRFEHPHVKSVVIGSSRDRIFCAGANIHMLASSSHPFKVNFCKYTNETRLYLEDASERSGIKFLAACNGPTAGGGYELALACDEIILVDDGSSTVSLPEVPLLAVLPGTGGLTRLVDKRQVRRDIADIFSTTAEGFRGKRAVEMKLIDASVPRSKFDEAVTARAAHLAALSCEVKGAGVPLHPLHAEVSDSGMKYRYVTVDIDAKQRTATLTLRAPDSVVKGVDAIEKVGADWWPLRIFRELDDAILRLRFNHEEIALVLIKTRGDIDMLLDVDRELVARKEHWFVAEVISHMARVLRRLEATAKSLFAVIDGESAFAGTFLEIALCADRRYVIDDPAQPVHIQAGALHDGLLLTSNDRTRLDVLGLKEKLPKLVEQPHDAQMANEAGLITVLSDEIDFDDTLRIAIEERASLSPDALTGMEASFRCVGAETTTTKIFGRLSAWQNWIFTRPNAVGAKGALSLYGHPERPSFDFRRT